MFKTRLPEWSLYHVLLNVVAEQPDAVAVIDGDDSYTYATLLRQSTSLAVSLQDAGLRPGARVGVYLEKSWRAIVSIMAVVQAGGVFVNISPLLKAPQVSHIVNDCDVRFLISDSGALSWDGFKPFDVVYTTGGAETNTPPATRTLRLDDVLSEQTDRVPSRDIVETDLGTIIYTSGSTGKPKGIMLTHHNLVVGAQIVSTYLANESTDRVLSVLPLNFDVGLNQFTTMLRVGGTLVIQRSMMPGDILRSLRRHRITGLAGVPGVWALLLQNRKSLEREPLTELRYISNTGGMIPQPHLDELITRLPGTRIFLMYGLTEAFRSTFCPPQEVGRGSSCIGKAIPNTRISVVDAEGRETKPDELGELIHSGPTIALGYWGDADKTNSVYRVNPFAPVEKLGRDVVVYSGDLVKRDTDGFLYYVGRRDEQIKTQGYRVSPLEIEELVQSSGLVYECAAFGKKDDAIGQRIVVVASLKPEVDPATAAESIRRACAESAPSHLVPQEVVILAELPKNANGKVDRSLLKHEYASI